MSRKGLIAALRTYCADAYVPDETKFFLLKVTLGFDPVEEILTVTIKFKAVQLWFIYSCDCRFHV